jgi:hypothetical protein
MERELEWPEEPGVYFVQAGDELRVKIGKANNVRARLTQLQDEANRLGVGFRLQLLHVVSGGLREEKSLHKRFAALRVNPRNEWFWLRDELLSFLNRMIMARGTFDLVVHVESINVALSGHYEAAYINMARLGIWTRAYVWFAELGHENFS